MHAHPRSRWTMEQFIEETFGAKPLFEASKLLHEAQAQVEELRTPREAAVRRRIAALLSKLHDAAQLHQWTDETDVIASLEIAWPTGPVALQRHLRAGMHELETLLHERLLRTVVARLKGRRP